MMRLLLKILAAIFILLLIFLAIIKFGPEKKSAPITLSYPSLPNNPEDLESYIIKREQSILNLRSGNAAEIVWANDSTKEKTAFSLVYLHGWGASHEEGAPIHTNIAKKYGMNLYLSRLSHHGIDDVESFNGIDPDKIVDSALEAIAIGKQIGEKVIILSTSTGGTLTLFAMANDPEIFASILCSPNIDIADQNSHLLVKPFGLGLAKLIEGEMHSWEPPEGAAQFWTTTYRTEALIVLRQLINATMTKETFESVQQPVLTLAYYEDEEKQDDVVSVAAMEKMHGQLGSKVKIFKKLGSVGSHIMCSPMFSADVPAVEANIDRFLKFSLKLQAIN